MKDFRKINNINELKQNLGILKTQDISLLDIYEGSNNSYFDDLLNSDLMLDSNGNPLEMLKTISDAEMGFDINANNHQLLQQLFNHQQLSYNIDKQHDEIVKILAAKFSLSRDSQINTDYSIFEYFIDKTTSERLAKTLKNLVEADLLPQAIAQVDEGQLPLLNIDVANKLANKITDQSILKNVINTLKNSYNLNELASEVLGKWNIPTDLVLKTFSDQGIRIDFNISSQNQANGTPLEVLTQKNLTNQFLAQANLVNGDLSRVLDEMKNHDVNWYQIFNNGVHQGKNFATVTFDNMPGAMGWTLKLGVIKSFAANDINLGTKDQTGNSALNQIANNMPRHDHNKK